MSCFVSSSSGGSVAPRTLAILRRAITKLTNTPGALPGLIFGTADAAARISGFLALLSSYYDRDRRGELDLEHEE